MEIPVILLVLIAVVFFGLILSLLHLKRKYRKLLLEKEHQKEVMVEEGKLSAAGKKLATFVHEISNPLAAFKGNLNVATNAQREELEFMRKLYPVLYPEVVKAFTSLIYHGYTQFSKNLTTKDQRSGRKKLELYFEDEELVERFDALRIYDELEQHKIIYEHKEAYELIDYIIAVNDRTGAMRRCVDAISKIDGLLLDIRRFTFKEDHGDGRKSRFSLTENVEGVLFLFNEDWKVITLEKYFDDVPELAGFPDKLAQVWINLLSNAIDACSGTGKIIIRILNRSNQVIIEFEDNGGGIAPSVYDKLFNDFVTSKPKGTGTGFGLSIAKEIVEMHGGEIRYQNAEYGALFQVVLPVIT